MIKEKLSEGGKYVLATNVRCASPTTITITKDLYICLNGYSIENVIFTSNNINNNLYITNCNTIHSNIVMADTTSGKGVFASKTEIYARPTADYSAVAKTGSTNITVKADVVYSSPDFKNNEDKFIAYGVEFNKKTSESTGQSVIDLANTTAYIAKSTFTGYKNNMWVWSKDSSISTCSDVQKEHLKYLVIQHLIQLAM